MGTRIYVGGLPYATSETRLAEVFATHGTVESVRIISDKLTGRSRGFGFVEMASDAEAAAAISALNGTDLEGRTLTVNEARPQQSFGGGGFGDDAPRRSSPGRGRAGQSRGRW